MKFRDIKKINSEDRKKKLKELKLELAKSKINATKEGSAKTKNIKKIIARILTLNNQFKKEVEKNK